MSNPSKFSQHYETQSLGPANCEDNEAVTLKSTTNQFNVDSALAGESKIDAGTTGTEILEKEIMQYGYFFPSFCLFIYFFTAMGVSNRF